jgi:hypothetical protein
VAKMIVTLRTGLYLLITRQELAGVELVGLDLQCALDGAREGEQGHPVPRPECPARVERVPVRPCRQAGVCVCDQCCFA